METDAQNVTKSSLARINNNFGDIMIYYDKLIESEKIKIQKTNKSFGKELEFVAHIYNYLLVLPFSTGKLCDDSDKSAIQIQDAFCQYIYEVPFNIRSIYKLLEIANYADAAILLRTLIEATMVYKFYISKNDGDGLSKYILRKSGRSIKDIMESVLPGYYDSIYASLCQFAHGDIFAQTIFRSNVSANDITTNINNIYHKWFYYVSNQTISIIPCIFDMYDVVFPNNTLSENLELVKERKYVDDTVLRFIEEMIENDVEKSSFYHYYKELINRT